MKIAIKAILVLAITLLGCSQVYAVNKKGSCGAGTGNNKTSKISAKAKSHSCTNKRGTVVKGHKKTTHIATLYHFRCSSLQTCKAAVHNLVLHYSGAKGFTCSTRACMDAWVAAYRASHAYWEHYSGRFHFGDPTGVRLANEFNEAFNKFYSLVKFQGVPGGSQPGGGSGGVTPNTTPVTPSNTQTRPRSGRSVRGQSRRLKQQIQRCRAIGSLSRQKACLRRIQ
ncbi:MAG: hypothetical protein K0U29_04280 [Gammaproteobacteria bacterium]|nr:hypothetical protein [Gammaproteobacteria bacterium]MCH9744133.1 hypothetical protein [Gammaproteobacteria bacterium]